jgi:glycerophosphoryl diester phosphodiesterase
MKKGWSIKKGIKKIILCMIAVAVCCFVAWASMYFHRSDPQAVKTYETENPHIKEKTQISAHRSGGGIMPEETMMAFKNCTQNVSFSIDVFEFDLHLTKDNVLVLLHDDYLDRTSNCEEIFGETKVRAEDKTYEELRRLNMGAKFETDDGEMPYANLTEEEVPDDLRILSLDEILDYLTGIGDYDYIIEIKNEGELGYKGVDILYQTLKERNLVDQVVFGTFHAEVADYVDENYPDLMRGANKEELVEFYFAALTNKKDYVPPCKVLQLPYADIEECDGVNLATAQIINYAHANDMAVQYWTINEEEDMEYLSSIGADCIMSDYPDRLYQVLSNQSSE